MHGGKMSACKFQMSTQLCFITFSEGDFIGNVSIWNRNIGGQYELSAASVSTDYETPIFICLKHPTIPPESFSQV